MDIFKKDYISLTKENITRLSCDAIVNAANNSLLGGGGVDGAIHRAAGRQLYEECLTLNGCKTGEVKITKGYNLPAKHVIHTVGPIYSGRKEDEELLKSCYEKSLDLAKENNLHSIAFPAISTGVYGYPKKKAASDALEAIRKWKEDNKDYEIEIILSCFEDITYDAYYELLSK